MKFSEQWLRKWINPELTSEQLASQLTMAGLEVEDIQPIVQSIDQVVVGEIVTAEPHPNAERLKVCQVLVAADEQLLNIVCGADNARAGIKVPVALVGAVLPNGLIIKKARLRGVDSHGMLCSASEVGLEEASRGLMELPLDAPVGVALKDYLQLEDSIFNINVTPNRGDCLSIAGLAREVAALNNCPVIAPVMQSVEPALKDTFPIALSAPEACPRYLGRVIRNIDLNALSPLWLKEKLRRHGLRSIHPVVDITNYVMLELGQPLHAFDMQRLAGNIEVRFAKAGEKIALLNEQHVELAADTLIIADAKQPQAIAGIMGGIDSSVTTTTKDIFLECAFFNPQIIATTLRRIAMQSDAGYRFERGVDYQLQEEAMQRATALIITICGGQAGPINQILHKEQLPQAQVITLRRERIARILGSAIPDDEITRILAKLGLTLTLHPEGWLVAVPTYRFDLVAEIDLIEELARVYGYAKFKATRPITPLKILAASEKQISLQRLKGLLVDKGYHEVITYSFVSPSLQAEFEERESLLSLTNPISQDMSVMRTCLWSGLLKMAVYNFNRQQPRIRVFENGLCFSQLDGKLVQRSKLGGLVMGSVYPQQWGTASRCADFFDIKGDLESLFALTKNAKKWKFRPGTHLGLHPTQTAAIYLDEQVVGYLGALHPNLTQKLGLEGPIFLFEVELEELQQGEISQYKVLSKFPMIKRDLALVVDKNLPIQAMREKIISIAGDLLQQVQLFDIYQGKGIDLDKKSLALSLTFQHTSRTLIDEEVNMLLQKIINILQQELGAKLRE